MMMQVLLIVASLFVLLFGGIVGAQDMPAPDSVGLRPDAPEYALHGPYWVGTREFVIDLDGNESFNITVWYPAQAVDESAEPATYDYGVGGVLRDPMNFIQGTAFRDAAPDINGAPYPLLVFSPGMGTSRMFTLYLLEHLASRGFVVISLDHVGTRLIDQITMEQVDFADQVFLSQARRPLQMHLALDYAETLNAPESDLGGMIDLDKIAFGGYSAGGWAALALAGGQIDLGYLRDWCAQGVYASVIVSTVCNRIAQGTLDAEEQRLMELAGVEAQSGAMWSPITDSRVDAILALAPGGMLTFGEDGLQNVTVPTLILYGSADPMAIPEYNAQWTYDRLGSAHKGMASFADGGHMLFGQCNAAWTMNAPDFCLDSVWDMTRAHDLTNHFATAFLLDVLEGDADAHAALAPDAVAFPGISYEAAGF
jgi:predicted dienelactone hydrolase